MSWCPQRLNTKNTIINSYDAKTLTEVQLLSFIDSTGGKVSKLLLCNIQNLGAIFVIQKLSHNTTLSFENCWSIDVFVSVAQLALTCYISDNYINGLWLWGLFKRECTEIPILDTCLQSPEINLGDSLVSKASARLKWHPHPPTLVLYHTSREPKHWKKSPDWVNKFKSYVQRTYLSHRRIPESHMI